jgi:hypothetical protein
VIALVAAAMAAEIVTASLVLRVDRPGEAVDAVIADARSRGGWFARRTDDEVTVRIPVSDLDAAQGAAAALGRAVAREIERTDVTEQVADLTARVTSRRDAMARYEAVLAEATPKSVVTVQRQILHLVQEIEELTGKLRVLDDRSRWATLHVATRFEDRRPPARDGSSSFEWIDALDLGDLLSAFHGGTRRWTTAANVPVPDGFSAWRRARHFRAVSADGVVFRVRTFRGQPEADLGFWTEALRNHLDAGGYRVTGEHGAPAGGQPAVRFEAEAPCGQGDCAWRLVAAPRGRGILVVEAAGPVTAMEGRAEAVDAAARDVR